VSVEQLGRFTREIVSLFVEWLSAFYQKNVLFFDSQKNNVFLNHDSLRIFPKKDFIRELGAHGVD